MTLRARGLMLVFIGLSSGCPPPPEAASDAGVAPSPDAGFEPVLVSGDCPPGTLPAVGEPECRPVGWSRTRCPAGFEPDPSGWGCIDVLPGTACQADQMEVLGEATCQAIGSCTAPFPPAEATHFVDSSYSSAQLDATHFKSILAALRAAPAGAVIAVEAGTYPVSLDPKLPVRIVGRCAAQVRIDGLGAGYAGVDVTGTRGVELQGLTITGHTHGVQVFGGGSVTLTDCRLEKNVSVGLLVSGAGSQATASGTLIRATLPDGFGVGWGVAIERGGQAGLRRSALVANTQAGAVVRDLGSKLLLERSSVLRTVGRGIEASAGALLELTDCALVANQRLGLAVHEYPSAAKLIRTAIRDTRAGSSTVGGRGISVQTGASIELSAGALVADGEVGLLVSGADDAGHRSAALLEDVVVRDMRGNAAVPPGTARQFFGRGLNAQGGARLELRSVALVNNEELGLFANGEGTEVFLSGSLILKTRPNVDGFFGEGLVLQSGAVGQVEGSAFVGNRAAGVDADDGAQLRLVSSVVRETQAIAGDPQFISGGVIARHQSRADIVGTVVEGNVGIGLLFWGSQATVSSSFIARNTVGIHLRDASTLREVASLPEVVEPATVLIVGDTRFVGNGTRMGSGAVPLPELPGALGR